MKRTHSGAGERQASDDQLRLLTIEQLYDMASRCEVVIPHAKVCDECAAYFIAQEKEEAQ